MKKFEYFTYSVSAKTGVFNYRFDFEAITAEINRLGSQGWELVSVIERTYTGTTNALIYTFKREIL